MLNYRIRLITAVATLGLLISSPICAVSTENVQSETSPPGDTASQKKPKLLDLWRPGDSGQRMNIRGRVTSIDGTPIVGAIIFIRQADGDGDYQDRYSAKLVSDHKGGYQFASVLPGSYYGIKHVHVWVTHDAYQAQDTRIEFKGDPNLDEASSPRAIFLEEGNIKGETVLYGRFDILMTPK